MLANWGLPRPKLQYNVVGIPYFYPLGNEVKHPHMPTIHTNRNSAMLVTNKQFNLTKFYFQLELGN